jgi:predicted nucleic acid-binding protein
MEGVASLRDKRVYLDANIFIYAVEKSLEYASFLESLFELLEAGHVAAVTSELTLAEVLVRPLEEGRGDIARVYEEMITPSSWLSMVLVERAILVCAARLSAELFLKLPDAIHVASAIAGD